jgi:Helix-turn-helix domain
MLKGRAAREIGPPAKGKVVDDRAPRGVRKEAMKLLTTKSLSELLAVPVGTIRYWRNIGIGPPWVKLEGSIRYVEEEVLSYIKDNRRTPSVRAYMEEKDVV